MGGAWTDAFEPLRDFIGRRIVLDVLEPDPPDQSPFSGEIIEVLTEQNSLGRAFPILRARLDAPLGIGESATTIVACTERHEVGPFRLLTEGKSILVNLTGEPSPQNPHPIFRSHPWGPGYLGFGSLSMR